MSIDPAEAILRVVQFIILLTFHEWGHAKSANMLGDPTAEDEGRMTFNPAAHIDIIGTVMLPLIGTLFGGLYFGWAKPVPVNPYNLRNPKRDLMIIAAAGPIMNILCTIVILGCLSLLSMAIGFPDNSSAIQSLIYEQLVISAVISVFLAVFNMLPIFPLDGYSVLYGLLPWKQARSFERSRPYGMMILMGIIFIPSLLRIPNPVFELMRYVTANIFYLIQILVRL